MRPPPKYRRRVHRMLWSHPMRRFLKMWNGGILVVLRK
jgi:hypothetical protein